MKGSGVSFMALTKVFRHNDAFVQTLSELRTGDISLESFHCMVDSFGKLSRGEGGSELGVDPLKLPFIMTARKHVADAYNDSYNQMLVASTGRILVIFQASDHCAGTTGSGGSSGGLAALGQVVPMSLEVCVGSKVKLLVKAHTETGILVPRGTRGIVKGLYKSTGDPLTSFVKVSYDISAHDGGVMIDHYPHRFEIPSDDPSGNHTDWRQQIPLRLSFAETVHSSQGAEYDQPYGIDFYKALDVSHAHKTYMTHIMYAAITRATSVNHIHQFGLTHGAMLVNNHAKAKDEIYRRPDEAADRSTKIKDRLQQRGTWTRYLQDSRSFLAFLKN